jgi:Rieske Fe-S protein
MQTIAACRDQNGGLHLRSAACTHTGGIVQWNVLEKCWDCPCHGCHYSIHGKPINGPAVFPLAVA